MAVAILGLVFAAVENIIAIGFACMIYKFVKIFYHESTNFYSRVSALILCAGLFLRIILIFVDSIHRYFDSGHAWYLKVETNEIVTFLLIYDPMIIFTIPVFAIICDWTEGFTLLLNPAAVDRNVYHHKQRKIKNTFLFISTAVIMAMWINLGVELLNKYKTVIPVGLTVVFWAGRLFSLLIILFVLGVTVQIFRLYVQVMTVLKNLQILVIQQYEEM